MTPEEFHLAKKIHENPYKKYINLTIKRHMWKFDEFTKKN